jgi:hypothetical protein
MSFFAAGVNSTLTHSLGLFQAVSRRVKLSISVLTSAANFLSRSPAMVPAAGPRSDLPNVTPRTVTAMSTALWSGT